jgi:hypothetical protein
MLLVSALLIVVGAGVLAFCARYILSDHNSYSDGEFLAWIGGIAAALVIGAGIIIPLNVYAGRAYGRVECRNWGKQTDRSVRFVAYTSWDTGNCLTRDDHGKWISKDLVRQFGSGR